MHRCLLQVFCFLLILAIRNLTRLYSFARSDFVHFNYKGFYTVVLENDDSMVSVASIRYHVKKKKSDIFFLTCSRIHSLSNTLQEVNNWA